MLLSQFDIKRERECVRKDFNRLIKTFILSGSCSFNHCKKIAFWGCCTHFGHIAASPYAEWLNTNWTSYGSLWLPHHSTLDLLANSAISTQLTIFSVSCFLSTLHWSGTGQGDPVFSDSLSIRLRNMLFMYCLILSLKISERCCKGLRCKWSAI